MKSFPLLLLLALPPGLVAGGERVNHEGRLLGALPAVTAPLLFNTTEADAVRAAMQIMPVTSAWNEDVSARPLLTNSAAMMTQLTADLASSRRTLRPFFEMNYVLVPDGQPAVPIHFVDYPDESDLEGGTSPTGLYPIPANLPIETWPVGTGAQSLSQWQMDAANSGGDRHSIMVKPGAGFIWETWQTKRVGAAWQSSNGAKFSLATNASRPAGWTSADAAGLPMFPALVRYDECQRGVVEHALRLVVKRSRREYLYPAVHQAGSTANVNVPAMGQRLRLKASYAIPAGWTQQEKAVLAALKKYGAIVADNGGFFSVSVCPDDRFPAGCFDHLATVGVGNFEVVQGTTATTGPRSAGAPTANAGADQSIAFGGAVTLGGSRTGTGTILWKALSGPGTVTFANAAQLSTTATFSHPGHYVLALSVADGTHAVTYDPVAIDVVLHASLTVDDADAVVQFPSLSGRHYRLEYCAALTGPWLTLRDNVPGTAAPLAIRDASALGQGQRFYRVRVLP